jgi:hypothetical protein
MFVVSLSTINCSLSDPTTNAVWPGVWPGDLRRLDAGCSHIGDHRSSRRLKLTTRPGVEENRFVAELEQSYIERNRHDFIGDPRGSQCGFGFLNGHILDKRRIVRFFPNAIVQDEPIDLT